MQKKKKKKFADRKEIGLRGAHTFALFLKLWCYLDYSDYYTTVLLKSDWSESGDSFPPTAPTEASAAKQKSQGLY